MTAVIEFVHAYQLPLAYFGAVVAVSVVLLCVYLLLSEAWRWLTTWDAWRLHD